MKSATVLILAALLGGCAVSYRYVAVPQHLIPLPAETPKVFAEELECLADETYIRVVERERALRFEIEQYRALLGKSRLPSWPR
jgi:hypothetical protein